jgi:hypothetical protein
LARAITSPAAAASSRIPTRTFVRREGLALLDAQLAQHRQVEAVALVDDLVLVDVVQALPVGQAARLITRPGAAVR